MLTTHKVRTNKKTCKKKKKEKEEKDETRSRKQQV